MTDDLQIDSLAMQTLVGRIHLVPTKSIWFNFAYLLSDFLCINLNDKW
jgi:hypothetical protein